MIDLESRCLYIHIPKTGGNSINRAFGVGWEDHKDLARYARELPPETFRRCFKFAIVRNPWDRLYSDYNYQRRKSRPAASKLLLFKPDGRRRSFAEWVGAVLTDPQACPPSTWGGDVSPGIHRWSPQFDWISLDGRIAVDRVLRLEQIDGQFPSVCRELGRPPVRLAHRNRRFHLHYSWYYDEATRARVAAYYARDIEAFGYRFETRRECFRRMLRTFSPLPFPTSGWKTG
jgi:hypothetical protein